MRKRSKSILAAFCITTLVIAGICGFVAVDLSTDRYMPGRFGPLFQVSSLSEEGARFSFMGEEYHIQAEPFEQLEQVLYTYRGLLPATPRAAQALTQQLWHLWVQKDMRERGYLPAQ